MATLSLGATATFSIRPKAKSGIGAISKNAKGSKPDALKLRLDHGDLIIMHGSGIQKFYEVACIFSLITDNR